MSSKSAHDRMHHLLQPDEIMMSSQDLPRQVMQQFIIGFHSSLEAFAILLGLRFYNHV
jgi:hypothetical protein